MKTWHGLSIHREADPVRRRSLADIDEFLHDLSGAMQRIKSGQIPDASGTSISAVSDHGLLLGLADDDHTQYTLNAGRSGSQIIRGGLLDAETLTLRANAADSTTSVLIRSENFFERVVLTATGTPGTAVSEITVRPDQMTLTAVNAGDTAQINLATDDVVQIGHTDDLSNFEFNQWLARFDPTSGGGGSLNLRGSLAIAPPSGIAGNLTISGGTNATRLSIVSVAGQAVDMATFTGAAGNTNTRVNNQGILIVRENFFLFGITSGFLTQAVPATVTNWTATWPAAAPAASNAFMLYSSAGAMSFLEHPGALGRVIRSTSTTAVAWGQVVLTTDVTGVLPAANLGQHQHSGASDGGSTITCVEAAVSSLFTCGDVRVTVTPSAVDILPTTLQISGTYTMIGGIAATTVTHNATTARTIAWPDADGSLAVSGDGADPPAAGKIGQVNRTLQTASLGPVVLCDASPIGVYVIFGALEVTTAGAAGTLEVALSFTDDAGAVTGVLLALMPATAIERTSISYTLYKATNGSNVSWSTTVSGTPGALFRYALRLRVLFLRGQ